jgi:hypothetical protein
MSELSDPRGAASRAASWFSRRTCVRSILLGALVCAVPAQAVARPLGQPYLLGLTGHTPQVVFNDHDGRYLLSANQVGHGRSLSVSLADVGASGAPGERSFGSAGAFPFSNALAYDARRGRYLVVFSDSPEDNGLGGFGIYGEIRAADGRTLAGPVLLTPEYGEPAVAYDRRRDQYLLVVATSRGGSRVVGVRLSADLVPLGGSLAVSDRPEVIGHRQPAVVHRPAARDFVVTWLGERADGSADVFAQRIGSEGVELGPDDLGVSTGASAGRVLSQSLAASVHEPEAAVAWSDAEGTYARRIGQRPSLGAPRTVSGPDNHHAPAVEFSVPGRSTAIAYQPQAREWLVAWSGTGPESPIDDVTGAQVESIFGQHLSGPRLRERGPDDFPISQSVPPDRFHPQSSPALAADPTSRKYLAVWSTDFTVTAGLVRVSMRRIVAEPPRR